MFGLRDLFENSKLRADTARLAMERINEALLDLDLRHYAVTEVIRELSPGRDVDTYSITIEIVGTNEAFRTSVVYEP